MPARFLESKDPQTCTAIVNYSYVDNKFEKKFNDEQMVMHFMMDGETILKESEEAKVQEEIQERRQKLLRDTVKHHELSDFNGNFDVKIASMIMKNKFNYSERQTQTPIQYLKELGVSTVRLKLRNFSGEVNLSWIYDLFIEDFNTHHKEEDDKGKKGKKGKEEDPSKEQKNKAASIYSTSFKRCLKIMERMVVQNEEEDKYSDYRYMFTEKGPEISKAKEKNIYPLWRF